MAMLLLGLLAAQTGWAAEEAGLLQIQVGEKVIFCSARLPVDADQFRLPMQDGIAVVTQWHLKIGKVRNYWLNKTIGEITVIRRVEPDLLSHSWLLLDVNSGISHRVYQIKAAVDFLTRLDQFPILDRSLLLAGLQYNAVVNIEIHIGDVNDAWWAGLWPSTANAMQQDFKLP
ncbi:MAG: DUF4390 domain-containing protein [Mariprofundus sp.]|nr:DUF4390 domain-containing protein [Mariprofundus sp.]